MTDTVENLILDLVEWVGRKERTYRETMDAWRTSCPRLPVWEDAASRGFVETDFADGCLSVRVTAAGLDFLKERRPNCYELLKHQEIFIRDTKREELPRICEMEQGEARNFIIPYSLERHHAEFAKPGISYKSIFHGDELIGFLILAVDSDARSVEFRRIVVSEPSRGYGKKVLHMIDEICRREFRRTRVWLDVFETNERARRLYEQCGYRRFGKSEHEGRALLLYEKGL